MTPLDFDALVHDHGSYVRNVIARIVGYDDADDVAQKMWLRVWKKLDSFRGESAPRSWLHRYATNHALSFLRGTRAQKRAAFTYSLDIEMERGGKTIRPEFVDEAPRPDAVVLARERWCALQDAVCRLDAIYQAAAIEALGGASVIEGAAAIGIKPQTYKSRLHRARSKLIAETAYNRVRPDGASPSALVNRLT